MPDDVDLPSDHRVKVSGTVTYKKRGVFFLEDDTGGTSVETSADAPLAVGEVVTAVGFPDFRGSVPKLTESLWRPADGPEFMPLSRRSRRMRSTQIRMVVWSGGEGLCLAKKQTKQKAR